MSLPAPAFLPDPSTIGQPDVRGVYLLYRAPNGTGAMGLLTRLGSLFGSEERTFHYRCLDCDAEFESPNPVMAEVTCPECRSSRIRSIAAPEA